VGAGAPHKKAGRIALTLGVAILALACILAPAADAKKKKKKVPVATTATGTVAFASGASALAAASCPTKTHVTGGGFNVAPSYDATTNTGLRNYVETSSPAGNGWNAYGSALTVPASSGTLSAYARCEANTEGRIAAVLSSTTTVPPGTAQNNVFNCPPGTHVISGGYSGDGPAVLNNPLAFRIIVLQSHRTGPGQWTVAAYNRTGAPPSSLSTYAICEVNGKSSISESSLTVPVGENQRAASDATCAARQHVVSGGFAVNPTGPGQVPVLGIDENQPVGSNVWHVGLYDSPSFGVPPGTTLQTTAYCKPNSAKKKKHRKH
jgi:hypothetical protein